MKVSPPFGTILLLIGITFSLHAFPFLEEERFGSLATEQEQAAGESRLEDNQLSDDRSTGEDDLQSQEVTTTDAILTTAPLAEQSKEPMLPTKRCELPIDRFIDHYNRANDIQKRIALYKKELRQEQIKNPSLATNGRVFILEHLISTLSKAADYQSKMVKCLEEQVLPSSYSEASLKNSNLLARAMQINEAPNKIERIADGINLEGKRLAEFQMILDVLEPCIAALPQRERGTEGLQKIKSLLDDAMIQQRGLINDKAAYAQMIVPPFKKIETSTQIKMNEYAFNFRKIANLINQKSILIWQEIEKNPNIDEEVWRQYQLIMEDQLEEEQHSPQPQKQVVELLMLVIKTVEKVKTAREANNQQSAKILKNIAQVLFQAVKEAQQLQPRNQAISLFRSSAEAYQRALRALESNNQQSQTMLCNAANMFFKAAEEAQQLQPREQAVSLLRDSAEMHQAASSALEDNDLAGNISFGNSARVFFKAAEEAQQDQPRQEALELLSIVAEMYQKAAKTYNREEVHYFESKAYVSLQAAEEMQKDHPRQRVIDLWMRTLTISEKERDAFVKNDEQKECYFRNAAQMCFQAAEEAQKLQPREKVINNFLKWVDQYEQEAATGR